MLAYVMNPWVIGFVALAIGLVMVHLTAKKRGTMHIVAWALVAVGVGLLVWQAIFVNKHHMPGKSNHAPRG